MMIMIAVIKKMFTIAIKSKSDSTNSAKTIVSTLLSTTLQETYNVTATVIQQSATIELNS